MEQPKMIPETTFIYALNDPETGRCRYIGKADNPRKRFKAHLWNARRKRSYLGCWITGLQSRNLSPALEIIDQVPYLEREFWEQEYIRVFKMIGVPLTNLAIGGEGVMTGRKHSLETRSKISALNTGRKHSAETLARMSASRLGKRFSTEHRAKISAASLGKIISPETRAKISAAQLGKKISLETRSRISATISGEGHPCWGKKRSPETCAKIGEGNRGKTISLETRAKLRAHNLGKTLSPETRAKMGASRKLWWGKRKTESVSATPMLWNSI